MKIIFHPILFISFFLTFCSAVEEKPTDPEGMVRNAEGEIIAFIDKDCENLSDNLEPDVLSLVSERGDPFFYKEARRLLEKEIPNFVSFKEADTPEAEEYAKRDILEFQLSYDRVPFCNGFAKIYKTSEKVFLTGNIPPKDLQKPINTESPREITLDSLEKKFETTDLRLAQKKEPCYTVKNKQLTFVWKQRVHRGASPYEVLGYGEKILSVKPLFFHATGTAKIYDEDDTDKDKFSALKSYEIKGMSTGGSLCTERFHVIPEEGEVLAYSEDLNFIFDPISDLEEFEQVALFAYAEKQADYIKSLVHTKKWYGPQVQIKPDTKNGGITNNVFYLPGDDENPPIIQVPKGNGVSLHQVRLDNEAIQHEVGHHVLFRSVKTGSGESGILHEGIADILVMLRTKNACLGEHLCLSESLCISLQCLRSADNELTLTSYLELSGKHKQSQLISGLLWDIALEVGHNETAAWINHAIDLLPRAADFSDFITALYNSLDQLYKKDKEEVFNTRCEHLMAAYEKRGFLPLAESSELSCEAG